MDFNQIREQLLGADLNKGLQAAADLRERMEIVHTSEYPSFISSLLGCFVELLRNRLTPQMVDNKVNKFRHVILEILHRLPNNEVLKPHVQELLLLVMTVVDTDNEDNAIQGLRVVFDLQKNYRPQLESEVPRFLQMVNSIYRQLGRSVHQIFGAEGIKTAQQVAEMTARKHAQQAAAPAPAPSQGGGSAADGTAAAEPPAIPLLKSKESFKVLTECPLIVMLLFQLYPKYIKANIPDLIPLMIDALRLAPTLQRTVDGVMPPCLRARYKEMIACQVKTLSFLTYLLRGFTPLMQPYEKQISSSVINLLKNCPADAVATRKELLVATRHILATEFRKGFFSEVDRMLNEDLLVGPGRQARDTLRPLAYSTLADLVHHVKDRIDLDQVSRVIQVFSRNIHDPSLPIPIQTTSVRLLLNLVDYIFHNDDADAQRGKRLLQRVLKALVYKFGTLRHYMPLVEEAERARVRHAKDIEAGAGPKLAMAVLHEAGGAGTGGGGGGAAVTTTPSSSASTAAGTAPTTTASSAAAAAPAASQAAANGAASGQAPTATAPSAPVATGAAAGAARGSGGGGTEAMEVDVEGTAGAGAAGGEEQVNVEDDVEIEVGAGAAAAAAAAAAASGGARAATGAAAPAPAEAMEVDGSASAGNAGGAVAAPGAGPAAAAPAATAAAAPVAASNAAAVPVAAASAVAAPAAGGGTEGTAARNPVQSGAEVANSAAAILKIAREPKALREEGSPRKFALGGPPEVNDTVQEVKILAKTMIQGLKTVIWCCSNYRQPKVPDSSGSGAGGVPSQPAVIRRPMTAEERDHTAKFFKWALPCLRVFTKSGGVVSPGESKDALDAFAGAFTVLGPYDLRTAVGRHISILFDSTLEDPSLLTIPQHLLANEAASCTFADVLLSFLVHQMDDLAGYEERRPVPSRRGRQSSSAEPKKKQTPQEAWKARQAMLAGAASGDSGEGARGGGTAATAAVAARSRSGLESENKDDPSKDKEKEVEKRARMKAQVLLRLFKVVFGSVTLFPKNERMLRPHLQTIVLSCLRYTTRVKDPTNYYFLLRALFRSISGGKFESSYKEIYPLLPLLLTELSKLHHRAEEVSIKNILVELCLTVPARLASLLPHLPLMMRLMVHALRCRGDLDGLALRTLEFWVDNLNPDYLYRIMSHDPRVLADVMTALCDNLRPAPFHYGTIALRLLGKLGGRNRRFLSEPMLLPPSTGTSWHTHDCFKLEMEWAYSSDDNLGPPGDPRRRFTLPMDLVFGKVCTLLSKLSGRVLLPPPTKSTSSGSNSNSTGSAKKPAEGAEGAGAGAGGDDGSKSVIRDTLQESLLRHKRLAFRLVLSCLAPILSGGAGLPPMTEEEIVAAEKKCRMEEGGADMLERPPESFREAVLPEHLRYKAQFEYKARMMSKGIGALIVSASDPDLKDTASSILHGVILNCIRLTTPPPKDGEASGRLPYGFSDLNVGPSSETAASAAATPAGAPGVGAADMAAMQDPKADLEFSPLEAVAEHLRGRRVVSPSEITDAIVDGLSDVRKDVQGVGLGLIEFIVDHSGMRDPSTSEGGDASSSSPGSSASAPRPVWQGRVLVHSLFESLCQGCFEKQWRRKISACRGIRKACAVMNWQTARAFEFKLMQALLFVIKDHPREVSIVTSEDAQSALYALLTTRYGIAQPGAAATPPAATPAASAATAGGPTAASGAGAGAGATTQAAAPAGAAAPSPATANGGAVANGNSSAQGSSASSPSAGGAAPMEVDAAAASPGSAGSRGKRNSGPPEVVIASPVVHLLATELSNYRHTVRSTAKRAIELMAAAKGCSTTDILAPCREAVETHIFSKQLRAVQASQQVGMLEALTYGLMLKPQLLTVTMKVMQILGEVLTMTEADDLDPGRNAIPALYNSLPGSRSTHTGFPSKTGVRDMQSPSELPHVVQLRVSAIRLMHIVMVTKPEAFMETDGLKDARTRCISLFFKSLTSRADQVVDAAQAALVQVIFTNRQFKDKSGMPKDLLQSCLRPVLKNLTHIQKLSLPLLQGLSRLLYLLSNWFNVTLGDKLFGYLRQWTEPQKLQSLPDPKGWKPGEEPDVAAAIMGLFHLLPHSPKFLDQLVKLTLQLEAVLHRYDNYSRPSNPFLVPLTKYLDRYATETMDYFLEKERLGKASFAGLLVEVLAEDLAKPLREKMGSSQYTDVLLAACFQETVDATKAATGKHFVALVDAARRNAEAADNRLAQTTQEHKALSAAVEDLKKRMDAAKEAYSRAQGPEAGQPGAAASAPNTTAAAAAAQAESRLQAAVAKLASLSRTLAGVKELVRLTKLAIPAQQKRISAQQATGIQQAPGGGFRLAGEETVLIPAPGAYPTSLSAESSECLHQGLRVVYVLAQYMPKYLEKQTRVVATLREVWRAHCCRRRDLAMSSKSKQQQQLRASSSTAGSTSRQENETKLLVKCMMECYRAHPGQVAMLLDLAAVFLYPTPMDFTFLKDFYRFEVPALAGVAEKRALFRVFLETLRDPNLTSEHKIKCLTLVVIPVLTTTLEDPHTNNSEVVTDALVSQLVHHGFGGDGRYPEGLRVGLLKLGALLIEFMHKELLDHRKELIKFAWNNIKIEDSGKHWAYVNVCRFICAYDTPPKIILQVYVQLLRCIQPEVKELVHAALDILVPALPFRLTAAEFMKAIKWTKKIMYEEGHALPQLIHMWHMIVRHPALFYSCRSHFVGQMVNSLSRLGLPPNCPRENRQLAVSLADLMIKWEAHGRERVRLRRAANATTVTPAASPAGDPAKGTKRSLEGGTDQSATTGNGAADGAAAAAASPATAGPQQGREKVMKTATGAAPGAGAGAVVPTREGSSAAGGAGVAEGTTDSYRLSKSAVETVVNFVVRVSLFAMANLKDNGITHLSRRCLGLLEKALELWPDTPIKYTYFEKLVHVMIDIDPNTASQPQLQATMKALPGVLEASLDILIISLGTEGSSSPSNTASGDATSPAPATPARAPNKLVLQNVAKFQRLLGPSLRADTPGIRQRLLRLIQRLAALYGPGRPPKEFQDAKFWDNFQGSVERRLKAALAEKPLPPVAHPSAWYGSAAASVSAMAAASVAVAAGGSGTGADSQRSKALSSVKIVESVSAVYPAFADFHATSLMDLVKMLSRQHFAQAAMVASTLAARYGGNAAAVALPPGLVGSDPMSPSARLLPTASMAVLNTAVTVEVVVDDAPLTEHVQALVICLKLLRDITARGQISDTKKMFQSLAAACLSVLEKSDNIVLLTTVMGFVKDWLLKEPPLPTSPSLSDQERGMFVQRLVRLDRLSEVHVQAVVKLQLEVIDALVNVPEGTTRPTWVQAEAPRLFMAGLMCSDPALRRRFSKRLVKEAATSAAAAAAVAAARAAGVASGVATPGAEAASATEEAAVAGGQRGVASPSAVTLHALRLDWEPLQLRFWPAAVADALLGLVNGDRGLSLQEDECLRPLGAAGGEAVVASPSVSLQGARLTSEEQECLTVYTSALSGAMAGATEVVDPLRGLLHADVTIADEVWARTLEVAWATFSDRKRAEFSGVAGSLLAKPWHTKAMNLPPLMQGSHSVNVIQSLLRAILALRPLPPLPVDLLGALAVGFNAWHTVIPALEHQVMNASPEERPQWMRILAFLYKHLGEDDVCSALRRRFAVCPETKVALSLETYGLTVEAQQMYLDLIAREQSGSGTAHVSQDELETWEERWIDCTRQLSQWSVLVDFSSTLQYPELMMESAWKARSWDVVRANMDSPTVAAATEGGSPFYKIYEIYLSIVDNKVQGMEKLCMSCVQLALHRWQLLPRVHTGCGAHKPLLHLFHQMVELRETGNIMADMARMMITSGANGQKVNGGSALINAGQKKPPELKATLYTWRERLPNKWDALKDWDDIFCWRTEVFRIITANFAEVDPGLLASLHDTPWTMIKLAHTARKQGLTEVCLNSLGKLYSVATMDVQDAFNKLREQIIICHKQPREHRGGLNMINNTNLEFFNSKQKAELFRLKGVFLTSLGAKQEANNAYSHAVQISGDFAKGWYSWARYCDGIFAEQTKVHCAVQAMACYLQAINHNSTGARLMMSRVLWLLSLDDEKSTLGRTLETYGRTLPEWVWIPWIPQLLTSLTRREAQYVTTLVKALSQRYPQSVYYTMRAFLLERREQPDRGVSSNTDSNKLPKTITVRLPAGGTTVCPAGTLKKHARQLQAGEIQALPPPGVDGAGPAVAPTGAGAAAIADELMSQLRRAHCALGAEMETILEEIIVHFRPEPGEELHSAVHALLIKCFQLVTLPMDDVIPVTLKSTLERVCRKFFNRDAAHKSPKHQRFVELYQATFEKDFEVTNEEKQREAAAAAAAAATAAATAVATAAAAAAAAAGTEPGTAPGAETPTPAAAAAAAAATAAAAAATAAKGTESRMTLTKVVYRLKKWKHLLGCRVFRAPSEVPLQRCSPYLAQVHCELETWHSSSQARIEIPGQYASCDGEPRPDLHAKLLRFHSTVSVLHRHGFSQRRLSMLGSDGRRYFFLVQFAIPHVTRTDERVMQVHSMLRKFLERDPQTRGRDLAVQVPVVVPITPRMRLMEDHEAFVSLGEIFEADRHRQGLDPDAPIMLCRERVSAAVAAAPDKEAGKKAESEERLKVFTEICNKDVAADILTRYVHGVVKDAEAVWAFRRHFAAQAGISSLLCHIFTCGERFPHRIIFDKRTARVVSWEFRPGYTHAGLLEQAEDVPFRLTRNMSTLMSPMLVEGVFALTMVSMSGALMAKKEVLEPFLSLILRDDLLSWHVSKAPVNRTEEQQKAVDVQLKERIGMNVTKVMSRLDKLKPRARNNAHGQPMPVDRAVHDLIAAAQSETNLAKMSPTFLSFV